MSESTETNSSTSEVMNALNAFRQGQPVCIHDADDREGETDLVYPALSIEPEDVARLRNDAGGLICVAVSDAVARELELPFIQEILDHPSADQYELSYDDRSSFSLTVNHRDTTTGITDEDRALTISELGAIAAKPDLQTFNSTFRAPGHVHILRGAENLLEDREGHTELGLALAYAAALPPAVVVCEMLNDSTGKALSPTAAKNYAEQHGIPFVKGAAIKDQIW